MADACPIAPNGNLNRDGTAAAGPPCETPSSKSGSIRALALRSNKAFIDCPKHHARTLPKPGALFHRNGDSLRTASLFREILDIRAIADSKTLSLRHLQRAVRTRRDDGAHARQTLGSPLPQWRPDVL